VLDFSRGYELDYRNTNCTNTLQNTQGSSFLLFIVCSK
jgi:hypothetical protein